MRFVLQLILLLSLTTSLWAQEDQITHTYELVLNMDEIPDGFIGMPTSIVRTPDKQHIIVCHSYGDSKVGVYRLSDGERIQPCQLKGDEHFLNYFFEGENVFIDGKDILLKSIT